MTAKSPHTVHQPESDWPGFLKLARQASETIGTEFLSVLARQLAVVLDAKCVYVSEFVDGKTNRVRPLAAFVEGGRLEAFEFPLAGSPDAEVTRGSPCMYPSGVREMFPGDPFLHDLEAEAWVGVTVTAEVITMELAEEVYQHLSEVTARGGPYAAICRSCLFRSSGIAPASA